MSSSLTDPGEVCVGDMVTLTCNIRNESIIFQWRYINAIVGSYLTTSTPPLTMMTVFEGIEFTSSLVSIMSGQIVSTLNFTASLNMNGQTISCSGNTVTLQVRQDGNSHLHYVYEVCYNISDAVPSVSLSLVDVHNDTNTVTLTIEWTIMNGRDIPSLEVTPLPLPHPPPVTTSTNTTITVLYNTNYTVTVSTTNCAGTSTDTLSFIRGDHGNMR